MSKKTAAKIDTTSLQEILIIKDQEKKKINFDLILLFSILAISGFGILIIYSATRYSMPGGVSDPAYYLKRQAYWLLAAVVVFFLLQFINYRILKKYLWTVIVLNILILASVFIFGHEIRGTGRWINLKLFSIQPSEFSKILMVISVSAILSKWRREKIIQVGAKKVFLSLFIVLICIAFVVLEPDYGTALIFFLVYLGILFLSGANFLYVLGILAAAVGGLFMAIKIGLVKQYQLDRILVFAKPNVQNQGIGFNLFQSKLAIGSGGLWGTGLFLGKQTNLSYVPEHHTDFIFSVIGEELGFFGSAIVVVVLALIIWRCFYISSNAKNSFGTLVAGGIGFIILTQAIINIGMTIGIMPVIGIPLPFLSYGGSNLLSIFIGLALVENIYLRRDLRKDYEIAYDDFGE
ncbi:MAG: rod shape-determining protein RodA [Actinobacteria bacterium]|nr:rod shape-determining protein RodA [Actinomycetota bacterium]